MREKSQENLGQTGGYENYTEKHWKHEQRISVDWLLTLMFLDNVSKRAYPNFWFTLVSSGRNSRSLSSPFPDSITVGSASVPLSTQTLSRTLSLTATWPWNPRSPIWCAHLTLNSAALVPSIFFCPQVPQTLLFLPFMSWLLQLTPLWLSSVSPIQTTEGSEQFSHCLKLTTFFPILFLSIDYPLIHGYSTHSLLSAISASAWLLWTTWLNSWEFTTLIFWYFHSLPSLSVHPFTFLMLHRLSRTLSLTH